MGKTAKRVAVGTLVAAAAGYIAGILTAPKSGRETREDIKNKAAETKTQAEKQLKKLHTELGHVLDEAREQAESAKGKAKTEIDAAMDKTKVVNEIARELFSALHEGDSDDRDLRKAIDEANKTISHLRTFLKTQ